MIGRGPDIAHHKMRFRKDRPVDPLQNERALLFAFSGYKESGVDIPLSEFLDRDNLTS